MESQHHKKKNFILDCCNKSSSRMPEYQSSKDIYLAGYYAITKKKNRLIIKKASRSPEHFKPSKKSTTANPTNISQSKSLERLKSSPNDRQIQALSSLEFRALLGKYRNRIKQD